MTNRDDYFPNEEPEFPPRFDFQATGLAPEIPADSLKLESRGTTQQLHQSLLWKNQTIHKNTTAAKLREAGLLIEAQKLEICHTMFTVAVCNGCNSVKRFPNRCDLFYCAECQPRRSEDRRRAVEWWTQTIKQPKHVVLTVVNLTELTNAHVQEFRKFFTRLRRSAFARNWIGGFYNIEVTNEGRGWHLHLHALIEARFIDSFQLSAAWERCTNGLGRIVKVKDARGKNYLAEVTKYAVKGVQLAAWTPTQIKTFVTAFQDVRTFGVFGSLYGKRTEFAAWFKIVRDQKPSCECGCSSARYFSEIQFLELDFVPTPTEQAIPPPKAIEHPEFAAFSATPFPR